MALLPRRAGLGFPSKNSRNRAPGPSPARGALRGARESPVQLTDGLNRTKETPTSPPAPCYAIIPARSFHALRVGNVGGELISQPPPNIPLIQQLNAGFQTGTDPAGSHTLTPTNTFSVTGLFNVAVPSAVSGAYQFYLGNNTRTPGREVRIRVLQTDSGPVLLFIWRDFVTGQNTIIDQVALTPAELAEPQLELEISHDVAN